MRQPSLRQITLILALLLAPAVAHASTPLALLNALPGDAATLAGTDIAYGRLVRQRLDVYAPSVRKGSAPVVVFFYGGSWNSGAKGDYAFVGRALAARGFVAVVADYRLVPAVRFPAFLEDGAKAVAWTRANIARYGGDPDRIHLLGHSAGAYNAAMIALDARYLRAEGLGTDAVRSVAVLAGPFDFLPLDLGVTIAAFGNAREPKDTQPISFATRTAPPMLLATGTDDTTVKPRNSVALAARLKSAGATVAVTTYPGMGHVGILLALSRPFRSKGPVLDDVVAFFRERR